MRIFVYEYACATVGAGPPLLLAPAMPGSVSPDPDGFSPPAPAVTLTLDGLTLAAIRREGQAMRDAVAADFRAAGFEVITLDWSDPGRERDAFFDCLSRADAAFIIAPEFDDILTTRCQWVESSGVVLLGTSAGVLNWLTDKWQQYLRLRKCGVAVPESWLAQPTGISPLVRKPRRGAGSWQVCLFGQAPLSHLSMPDQNFPATGTEPRGDGTPRLFDLPNCTGLRDNAGSGAAGSETDQVSRGAYAPRSLRSQGGDIPRSSLVQIEATECAAVEWLWQRYVAGIPASIACLCGESGHVLLRGGYQILSADGQFRYLGGELPLPPPLEPRARRLAEVALAAFPELRGYVGFDIVLGNDPAGREDYVIEINARLTTSYLGQRQLCRQNLAELLVRLVTGEPVAEPDWHSTSVRFRA